MNNILTLAENYLNQDCLNYIYSFIKPTKEQQTAYNFKLLLRDEITKYKLNELRIFKKGFYYINKRLIYNKGCRDKDYEGYECEYFMVNNITKFFITITAFRYNFTSEKFECYKFNKKIKLRIKEQNDIEDFYIFWYKGGYDGVRWLVISEINNCIEYNKPPEFIKFIVRQRQNLYEWEQEQLNKK